MSNILLAVLEAYLAFIPFVGPELSSIGAIPATELASNIVIAAARGAPDITEQIWPHGTADSRQVQESDLSQEFSGQGGIRVSLDQNLVSVMVSVQG